MMPPFNSLFEVTPYSIISAGTTVIAIIVGVLAWQRRTVPGGTWLAMLMIAVGLWSGGAVFEYSALDATQIVFWAQIEYFGGVTCPAFFLLFVLEYHRLERWLTPRVISALFIVPTITLGLVLTNQWHGLIWPSLEVSLVNPHRIIYGHGPAFWFGAIGYSYLVMFIGSSLLVRSALRMPSPYHRQVQLVVAGALIPWVVNVLTILGFSPVPDLDLTPLVMAVSGTLFAWGIFRFHLLQVLPVAHDLLIEKMMDGMIVLDEHHQIADVNPAAQAVLGTSKETAIGKTLDALLPELGKTVRRALDTPTLQLDLALTRDATAHFFDVRVSKLTHTSGDLLGWLVLLRDITERQHVEQALRESEARFQQLAEIFPETIFEADLTGQLTFANAHGLRHFGLSAQDLQAGISIFDLMLPEYRLLAQQRVRERLAGKLDEYLEYQARRRDGSTFYALAYTAPIVRHDQPFGIRGFVLDISARKQAEEALRESEAQLRALIDYSPASIIKFSPEGNILLWNAAAEKIYGWTASEVLGKPLPSVPNQKLSEKLAFQNQVNQGKVITYAEVQRHRKDGSPIDVGLSVAPLKNEDGQVYAQMSISTDISELKRAQAELARRAQTVALLEERARLGRDLHDSVTQLLYSVMLFADASKDAAQNANLDLTQQYLSRLSETARQALKELRLRVFELRPSVLEHEGLASALRQRLELVEQRAGVQTDLQITLPNPLPAPVELAIYWIAQEAFNNTLKHANATHVTLELRADENSLTLDIADDGKGFDLDMLQEHAGLGMASMRERVRDLGGTFQITSALGHGTRIQVALPGYILVPAPVESLSKENRPA